MMPSILVVDPDRQILDFVDRALSSDCQVTATTDPIHISVHPAVPNDRKATHSCLMKPLLTEVLRRLIDLMTIVDPNLKARKEQ